MNDILCLKAYDTLKVSITQYISERRDIMTRLMEHGQPPEWVSDELHRICMVIERNMERFGTGFPSACAKNGVYEVTENDDWTNGFWTGMLWIAYEYTREEKFKNLAYENLKSFEKRLEDHVVLEHHDIGFLYSLSVGAGYRILGEEHWKEVFIKAADVLTARFQEKGGFLQAWGKAGIPGEYRLIIDSLMNLPILYRASELSGNDVYRKIADIHYKNVISNIIREDYSTYHTFYFDPQTGKPDHGATQQGFSDESCWARGQAWAILGIPLNARISGRGMSEEETEVYDKVVEYFETHLPSDGIPYWDLAFGEGSTQPRDSSSLAIAACGMLENEKPQRALEMLRALKEHASTAYEKDPQGLLLHGVYAYKEGKGVDEPDTWGDYFYMEGLCRVCDPQWHPYW